MKTLVISMFVLVLSIEFAHAKIEIFNQADESLKTISAVSNNIIVEVKAKNTSTSIRKYSYQDYKNHILSLIKLDNQNLLSPFDANDIENFLLKKPEALELVDESISHLDQLIFDNIDSFKLDYDQNRLDFVFNAVKDL